MKQNSTEGLLNQLLFSNDGPYASSSLKPYSIKKKKFHKRKAEKNILYILFSVEQFCATEHKLGLIELITKYSTKSINLNLEMC